MTTHLAVHKARFFAATATCLLAALICLAPRAFATTGVLDQSDFPTTQPSWYDGLTTNTIAQVFTAGATGSLTDVELYLSASTPVNQPVTVRVTLVSGGVPDLSHVIGNGTIPSSGVTGSFQALTIQLATAAPVVSGQQYGLVLTSGTSTGSYRVNVQPSNTYTAGDADYYSGGTWHFDGDDLTFATFVTATPAAAPVAATRGAYCTVAGNTTDSGFPLLPGTFVNLDEGQVNADPSYQGATPANFIEGVGLTCAAPPAGYTRHDYATPDMNVDGGMYPYYSN